jgi:ABC-type multidrug transport system fused ATPase/permease subunit
MQKYLELTKKAWVILKPFHKRFYLHTILVVSLSLLAVYATVVEGRVFDTIVEKDLRDFILVVGLVFVLGLIESAVNFYRNYNEAKYLGADIAQYLQQISLTKILNLTPEQHIEDHSAIKQQIIVRGENAVETIIRVYLTDFLPNISYLFVANVALFFYSTIIGVLSLGFSIILAFWMHYFLKFYKPLIKQNRDNWTEQGKTRTEAFTHLQLIKLLGREAYFIKKYLEKRKSFADFGKHVDMVDVYHRARKSLYSDSTQNLLLLTVGLLAFFGNLSLATVYVVWMITARSFWSVSSLSNALRDMPLRYTEVEQYFEAIEKTPSFKETGNKTMALGGDIIVENLSFSYRKSSSPVFEALSFVVPSGKTTAFVGSSGSGKSTIIKLLMRTYNYENGIIKIGDMDVKELDARHLRESIGYVEQHVDLLDDTIKENILLGVPEYNRKATESRLEEVAAHARITEFYNRLGEKRFDTVVGERGIKLSGGERQRVGIARAIIKDPEILIFDEATSSLDTENEAKVMEAISDVSKGKTTIIIAHRLSTIRDADKIIVMDKGKVVGEGTHSELLETNEVYRNLVAHQV